MKVYCGECQYFYREAGTKDFDTGYFYEWCSFPPRTETRSNYRHSYTGMVSNDPPVTNEKNDCVDFVRLAILVERDRLRAEVND